MKGFWRFFVLFNVFLRLFDTFYQFFWYFVTNFIDTFYQFDTLYQFFGWAYVVKKALTPLKKTPTLNNLKQP
jgi:hypothetical protein